MHTSYDMHGTETVGRAWGAQLSAMFSPVKCSGVRKSAEHMPQLHEPCPTSRSDPYTVIIRIKSPPEEDDGSTHIYAFGSEDAFSHQVVVGTAIYHSDPLLRRPESLNMASRPTGYVEWSFL